MTIEDKLRDALARMEAARDAQRAADRDVADCALDFANAKLSEHGIVMGETRFTKPGVKGEWRGERDSYFKVGDSAHAYFSTDWRTPDALPRLAVSVRCLRLTKAGQPSQGGASMFDIEQIIKFVEGTANG